MSLLKVGLYEFPTNQFVGNLCLVEFGLSRIRPGLEPKVFMNGAKA
jgi:hypothetical protein